MKTSNFMVTCHGWSGSNWFAKALNLHTKIICTHSVTNELPSEGVSQSGEQENEKGRLQRVRGRQDQTLKQHFDYLLSLGQADAYGSVHRYRVRDLIKLDLTSGPNFTLANQVRHPVKLVNSGYGQLLDMVDSEVYTRAEVMRFFDRYYPYYEYIAARHDLQLTDWSVLCFLAACHHMKVLTQELFIMNKKFPSSHIIKMERLTTEKIYYEQSVQNLVGDHVEISEEYLKNVFSLGAVNRHAKRTLHTAAEQYSDWEDWQREAFSDLASTSNIVTPYTSIGYDFSFLVPSPLMSAGK